jgi:riboflavin synthase
MGGIVAVEPSDAAARVGIRSTGLGDMRPGDSVAVDGVCLTAALVEGDVVTADVMQETLRRTSFATIRVGQRVNLELAATPTSRLGGHLVQGHIDAVGQVVRREPSEHWDLLAVEVPVDVTRYIVEKGSIALDGVSLTVVSVTGAELTVSLIPETLRRTTLGPKAIGAPVNVEVDVIAKYVERLLGARLEEQR